MKFAKLNLSSIACSVTRRLRWVAVVLVALWLLDLQLVRG